MAVTIRLTTTPEQIRKIIEAKREQILTAIFNLLAQVGEQFVIDARNTDTYTDRTGNLRSSIGYVIYHNGSLKGDSFPGAQPQGAAEGRQLADEIAADHPTGFVLVCVAGMNYAASVEAKGYDVITNSSIKALANLKDRMETLKTKISKL